MAPIRYLALLAAVLSTSVAAQAVSPPSIDALRERFPTTSIDSTANADAALAATQGAKLRVDKDYKTDARECLGQILVNNCLDRVRETRRKRLADIDAVELDANRFKRRERDNRIEADRARREAERTSNAAAEADARKRNRDGYESRQAEAAKAVADRTRSDANRAASTGKQRRPPIKAAPPGNAQANAEQRQKNAADYRVKVATAATHQEEIKRRVAEKDADRKHRAEARAAKDAKTAAAAAAAATAAAQSPFPSLSRPKP